MSPTRVEDDPLDGTSWLLQPPAEQEAVEHNEDVSQGRPPSTLPRLEGAFEISALPSPSNIAGVEEAADCPMASMEHVRQWGWPIQRLGARRYVEEYRSINLDQVSLH